MFRITRSTDAKGAFIRVEGRLSSDAVADLRGEVEAVGPSVQLDLSGVTFLDEVGAHELLALSQSGIRLRGMSAYVQQVLKEAGRN